ncbi:branched-subunit amino acid transport protein AzlD [Streptomyces sp. 1114.5]|uniref:AzlD domain-containing protein n=1 Tax=Streptomyces sp. 1114.5 TaxID=1938830 RepID=UPI000EAFACB7|nr:AzlD domain-containing protein [Streptomyces sp. 1114.5]RKT11605.1 branched-subunit amino acid transport protein AzlD [Streptomyces sp. 1114.5]
MMPLYAVLLLAVGTYAFRIAGPLFGARLALSERLRHLLAVAATVLLVALVATGALTQGHGFAGWARPAGVLIAGVLALRRAPFPAVVVAGAATTAVLRLCGVG